MAIQLQLRRGTAAQNNSFVGAVGELTYDTTNKGVRVHDGTTGGGHVLPSLTAVRYPTAANGYTWYRKYSDGWVEQGGSFDYGALSSDFATTVTLPVTMANEHYTATFSASRNTADARLRNGIVTAFTKSVTQLGFGFYASDGSKMQFIDWVVRGQAA